MRPTDVGRGDLRELFDMRTHDARPVGAVHADRQQRKVRDRIPERFDALAGNKSDRGFVECSRYHDGHFAAGVFKILRDRDQARLKVQRINHRLRQQNIDAGIDQRLDLCIVR